MHMVFRSLMLLAAATLALVLPGCSDPYGQETPEQTIATARKMVEDGKTRYLANLIYAENEQWRKLLRRTGIMFQNLQGLGDAIENNFPSEVAELKNRTKQAVEEGKATSLMATLTQQATRRKRPSVKEREQMEQQFNDAIRRLFADPYGWIAESETHISTAYVNDNTVALLWDGKPVMAPLGMVMTKAQDGKWYFVLPTNFPGLNSFMPRSDTEFKLWGSIIKTFDNVILDLTREINEKRLLSFESVATEAGEKAFLPAVMVFGAYGNYIDKRNKEARAAEAAKPAATKPSEVQNSPK
jgi:hypothetical protein